MAKTPANQSAPLAPQNLDAEEAVLGAMMLAQGAIDAVLDEGVAARDFYRPTNGVIFDATVAMYSASEPVDALTLANWLAETGKLTEVGGTDRIRDLAAMTPAVSNVRHYARIVREMSVLRSMLHAGIEIQRLAYERPGPLPDLVDRAERSIFELALHGRTGDFVPLAETVHEAFERLRILEQEDRDIIGVPTGFRQLDAMTSGFQADNLIVLAARPSMGKSALGLNICAHVAVGMGLPVGLFTLEMSRAEVTQRMLASEALVDSQRIRNGKLTAEDWSRISAASARLHTAPLLIDDSGALTVMELRAKARRLRLRRPDLALIVVDYLQLMATGAGAESRQQDVSQTSRTLKVLASELGIPVLALSQLSRAVEQRHDKRPILSDLRESGAIEQDADLVMFLYRDEYYNPEDTDQEGIAELNLAKHRSGPTGMTKLAFVKRHTRFSDLAVSDIPFTPR